MGSTFANRWNLDLLQDTYERWRRAEPVDPSWRIFFDGFELGAEHAGTGGDEARQIGVTRLISAYCDLGHFLADLDPLGPPRAAHPHLELAEFGLGDEDLDRTFDASGFAGLKRTTLRELLRVLRETYCRTIGVEFMHIRDREVRRWLRGRMESCRNQPDWSTRRRLRILMNLHYTELFERFLQARYVGQKRFSLEGAESLIPMLDALVDRAGATGVREIVLGMAHRGRLNVLANILGKPYQEIFAEFEDIRPLDIHGDGDVKYHLGFSADRATLGGGSVHLSLTPNPSHLESVDPVVQGRVRAKQRLFDDEERVLGIPLLIHGDAAFAGQGVVAETLNLSQLEGYTTGGAVHIIVNNQIGFTTAPSDSRSTTYCTDIAKMLQAPIFHVNGEDPEAAVFITELAFDFRQRFKQDVFIDLVCYRRHGHNEADEPAFTQPVMYGQIEERPTVTEIYNERLIMAGALSADESEALADAFRDKLDAAQKEVKEGSAAPAGMRGFAGTWKNMSPEYAHDAVETGVPFEQLQKISTALVTAPDDFAVNPKITAATRKRHEQFEKGEPIDWGLAEAFAFGSLLLENTPVRLSGQDSRRGTFSQRHAVLWDAGTGKPYVPLNNLAAKQGRLNIYDSPLAEMAVLGFEFGFSLDEPNFLVMWEAQFGDFANGGQVIFDQFIACSQSKWQRDSGLVLLLPHGYEGQGSEHSSARLERYLQACAEDNIQVCQPTTPAQYFHLLRRQVKRGFRKPLVVMTPKSLLRHKQATSPADELTTGCFHEILDDPHVEADKVRRVLLCSGKIYYELAQQRGARDDLALVRVEQFYPLAEEKLHGVLDRYAQATDWLWVQEESHNMGGWSFMEPRLRALGRDVQYVGRDASASPATGSRKIHLWEQQQLVDAALTGRAPFLVSNTQPGNATPNDG